MTDRYVEIEASCPACGLRNVWFCSDRNCPKLTEQKTARDKWVELSREPPAEEVKVKETP